MTLGDPGKLVRRVGLGSQKIEVPRAPDGAIEIQTSSPSLDWDIREHFDVLHLVARHARDIIQVAVQDRQQRSLLQVVYVNPAREKLTGYPARAVVGQPPYFLQACTLENRPANLEESIIRGEPFRVDIAHLRKDGSPYWVEIDAVPVTDGQDDSIYWVVIQREVGEQREQENRRRLNEKIEILSSLAGSIANSLNNQVTAATARLGLLRDLLDVQASGPISELLSQIKVSLLETSTLSNRLVTFSGDDVPAVRPFLLDKVLTKWVETELGAVSTVADYQLPANLDARLGRPR